MIQPADLEVLLTRERQHRLEVSTLGDAGAVLGTGVPQVFKLPLGDDDAAGNGGNLPVVVRQRGSGDQPADYTHNEAGRFHSRRHVGNVAGGKKHSTGNPNV